MIYKMAIRRPSEKKPVLQIGHLYLIDNELSTNPSSADLSDDTVFGDNQGTCDYQVKKVSLE